MALRRRDLLRLLLVMLLWAACFPLITLGLDLAPHITFAALRAVLAGASVLILAALLRRSPPRGLRAWGLIAVTGFGATSVGFLGMFHAAEFVAPGLATVLANVQPLIAAVLAHLVLRERTGAMARVGLVLGFAGIAVMAWSSTASTGASWTGIAYILVATAGVAVGNVGMKRLAGDVDALVATGLQLLIGAIPLIVWSLLTEDPTAVIWSARFIVVLVTLSVLGTGLAYWLWFATLEQVELSRANAWTFLVPIFGLAIGAVFFDERPGWPEAAGAALTIMGIMAVQRSEAR
jgi:drug/metabolite transporter (DMT)-like permease